MGRELYRIGCALLHVAGAALVAQLGCGSGDARIITNPPAPAAPQQAGGAGGGGVSSASGEPMGAPASAGDPATVVTAPQEPVSAPGPAPDPAGVAAPESFVWRLPPGFPAPVVPEDNPMTVPKVELGRHLFYDVRLSKNETMSCATCHRQELAFTDGRAVSVGSTGESHSRGAMSLANVAYSLTLTWSHPYLTELERQAAVPLFGDAPVELGFTGEAELVERLAALPEYEALFAEAFPDDAEPIRLLNVERALATFERTLISGGSAYDRWTYGGDEAALSESARRGFELFYSERLECFHCHVGFTFSDQVRYAGQAFRTALFHNTGLYNIDAAGAYPEPNTGTYDITRDPADMGKFKAPSLRNVALTAPYMHDGSIATLEEVLAHYAAGGRTIPDGPSAGVGSASPLRSELIRGFELSETERADVIAFLESLTDDAFISNPAFQNPWTQ